MAVPLAVLAQAQGAAPPPDLPAGSSNIAPNLNSVTAVLDDAIFRASISANFQSFVKGCMAGRGFSYVPTAPRPASSVMQYVPSTQTPGGAKTFDSVSAQTYVQPTTTLGTEQSIVASTAAAYFTALRGVTPANTTAKALSKLDRQAYDGVSFGNAQSLIAPKPGGCEAKGRARVTYPAMNAAQQVSELAAPLVNTLTTGSAPTAMESAWSGCMASRGFAYNTFTEPPSILSLKAHGLQEVQASATEWSILRAEEVSTATASDQCMASSGIHEYIADDVTASWVTFRSNNLQLLQRAGGMTMEFGGAGESGGSAS